MKADKGFCSGRDFHNNWNTPGDTVNLKEGMKAGKKIDPAAYLRSQ